MIIYSVVFVLLLIPLVRYDLCGKKGGEDIWYVVLLVTLTLLAALRYRTGGDTIIYMDLFEDYPSISELSRFDFLSAEYNPMWYIYNSIFKSAGNSFLLFQFVQAIFVNCTVFWFLHKYCNWFFIAVTVYFFGYYFYYNMEIQREILCVCLFLISYPWLERNEYFKYYVVTIFAISIHISSVVLLIMPLLKLLEMERFWLGLIVGCLICILMLKLNLIDKVLESFLGEGSIVVKRYFSLDSPNIIGAIITILTAVPFLILFHARKRMNIESDLMIGSLLNLMIVIQCVGTALQGVARFSNYLMIPGMVFILNSVFDNVDKIRKSQINKILIFSVLFIYLFNLSYYYVKNKDEDVKGVHVYDRYIPYVSYLNPHKVELRERLMINERYEREIPVHGKRIR